jgi:hypothetical protein
MDSKLVGRNSIRTDGLPKPSVSCFGIRDLLLLELASGRGSRSTSNFLLRSGKIAFNRDSGNSTGWGSLAFLCHVVKMGFCLGWGSRILTRKMFSIAGKPKNFLEEKRVMTFRFLRRFINCYGLLRNRLCYRSRPVPAQL